jgi:hypothetical protein
MDWGYLPMEQAIGAFEQSVKKYPNIQPGEESKGR